MDRYVYNASNVQDFPVPGTLLGEQASLLEELAQELRSNEPFQICSNNTPNATLLAEGREACERVRARMIAVQEELDWSVTGCTG